MFHCREKELHDLNKRYQKGNFECIVVYGRWWGNDPKRKKKLKLKSTL